MKKRKFLFIIFIITLAIILAIISQFLSRFVPELLSKVIDDYEESKLLESEDVKLYFNDNYQHFSDSGNYRSAAEKCMDYLPDYEDFDYKDNIKAFYIQDASRNFVIWISFVLELQFDSMEQYREYIAYEHNRCSYTNKFNVQKEGYQCFVVENEDLTLYRYKHELPFMFGMLCENEEQLTVRLVYFYDLEGILEENFEYVFENTNCKW